MYIDELFPPDSVPAVRAFPKIIKPGTSRYYTRKELDALQAQSQPATPTADATTPPTNYTVPAYKRKGLADPVTTPLDAAPAIDYNVPAYLRKQRASIPAASTMFPGEDPNKANYVGRREVARQQAARAAASQTAPTAYKLPAASSTPKAGALPGYDYKSVMQMPGMQPSAAKKADFSVPSAYGKTTYSMKPSTAAKPAKAAAPLTPNEYIKLLGAPALPESQQFVQSLVNDVRRELKNITCKEDIARVKKLIDRAFVDHGLVNESAQALRDNMIRQVVTIGAQRRRQVAQR